MRTSKIFTLINELDRDSKGMLLSDDRRFEGTLEILTELVKNILVIDSSIATIEQRLDDLEGKVDWRDKR